MADPAKKKDWEMGLLQEQETPETIPTRWRGDGVDVRDTAQVVAPTAAEVDRFADARRITCASCTKFDLEAGQRQMAKEKFVARLVHEMSWKVKHLGAPPETIGLCGETNGERATSMHSAACQHYRPRRERVKA